MWVPRVSPGPKALSWRGPWVAEGTKVPPVVVLGPYWDGAGTSHTSQSLGWWRGLGIKKSRSNGEKKIINKSHFAGGGRNLCPSLPGTMLSTHVKAGCSLPPHSCLPTPKWDDGKKDFFLVSNLKKRMVATRDETNLGGIWMLFDTTRGKVLCLLPHWSQRQLSHWGFPEIKVQRDLETNPAHEWRKIMEKNSTQWPLRWFYFVSDDTGTFNI